jgi:energy-coupling factor transporter ATP-binding protein EcfA2
MLNRKALNLQRPKFAIKRICLWNVGSIDHIEVDFNSAPVVALYSPNGTGKSTILEAISIIGHIPCLHRYERLKGFERSFLDRNLPIELYSSDRGFPSYADSIERLLQLKEFKKNGLNSWIRDSNYSIIQYEVEDYIESKEIDVYCKHKFAIVIHSNISEKKDSFSGSPERLTRILSRHEFDNLTSDDLAHQDDRRLADNMFILYEDSNDCGQKFEAFCGKVAKGRRFYLRPDKESSASLNYFDLPNLENVTPRSVSYINTDLNDFGRGNDLRETPKDLSLDFGQEMFERLRVQLDDDGHILLFKDLRDFCRSIIQVESERFTDWRVVNQRFDLVSVQKISSDRCANVIIRTNRGDGLGPKSISHLSAGENEVFFVGLMLLNLALNPSLGNSIVIMDEPDLHISTNSRSQFFREVFALQSKHGDQMILASHSVYPHDILSKEVSIEGYSPKLHPNQLTKVITRKWIGPNNETRMTSSYDRVYLATLGRTPFPAKFDVVGWATLPFRSLWKWMSPLIYKLSATATSWFKTPDRAMRISAWTIFLSVITFLCFLVGALFNDQIPDESWVRSVFLLGLTPLEYHKESRTFLIAGAVPVTAILLVIIVGQFHRRRMLSEKRRALQGTMYH